MGEWWNGGTVEWWNGGTVKWKNGGTVEWWNGRMVERWNGGMVERWNGGMVERWNGMHWNKQEWQWFVPVTFSLLMVYFDPFWITLIWPITPILYL